MGKILHQFSITYPIIQAPMAGVTTPTFVAAAIEAGVLGSVGAGYLSAGETREFIRQVKERTDKAFAVNLFVPGRQEASKEQLDNAYEALRPIGEQLGMSTWETSFSTAEFEEQVDVIIQEGVKICSFTFGLPSVETVNKLKSSGVFLIGTATTVEEALLNEKIGMDAVVVQGREAGGHRGSFTGESQLIPLHELLQEVVKTVQIPVIAAGGIATREHVDEAISIGAKAVQIGTALLATNESGANPYYKKSVLDANKDCTVVTKAFSGKPARGITNAFIREMEAVTIAPYPYQNDLTKKIRAEAAKQGKPQFMSLWAGENVHLSMNGTIQEVINRLVK